MGVCACVCVCAVQRNFRRCDRDNEEARVSGRSRGPAAAFNRACRALLTLASISRRQTERLVSPVDSDPGIVEDRRDQQHLVPVVVHLVKNSLVVQQSRVGACPSVSFAGRRPSTRQAKKKLGNSKPSQRRIQRGVVRTKA